MYIYFITIMQAQLRIFIVTPYLSREHHGHGHCHYASMSPPLPSCEHHCHHHWHMSTTITVITITQAWSSSLQACEP
jgi:hypothetical protein